jgi:alpha-tubulin suppressor-like RCC1 family protein
MQKRIIQQGFALPTVVIATVVMFMILVAAVGATSSARVALDAQYYEALMKDAGESGLTYATDCMARNNGLVTWSSSKPLTSSTDCNGNTLSQCSAGCYLVNTPTLKVTFNVGFVTALSSGNYKMQSTGVVNLLRKSDGSNAKTMQTAFTTIDRYIDPPETAGGAGWQDNGHIGFFISQVGKLYGYGDNSANQLGPDSLGAYVKIPMAISLPSGVVKVNKVYTSGQGASIVCIIGSNQKAYCRGKPGAGEVGLMPANEGWYEFVLPAGTLASDLVIHGQGGDAACVITTAGDGYCAGDNYAYDGTNGNLGTGNTTDAVIPIGTPQKFIMPSTIKVKSMYVQDRLTCAIGTDDNLYCAGNNTDGTLGNGGSANISTPIKYNIGTRKALSVLGNYHNNGAHVIHVLANDGTIWGSGLNPNGELGDGTSGTARRTPVQFGGRIDYVSMITGPTHFCGITSGGNVYCAGNNTYGQLGTGACANSLVPVRFQLPAGQYASASLSRFAQSQWQSTQILTTTGNVYGAGYNLYGKLGNNVASNTQCSVVQMSLPAGVTAQGITTLDADSTYVFGSNGAIYGVGRNNLGQLGDGTTTNRYVPSPVWLPRYSSSY